MIKHIHKANFINGPRDIKATSNFLSSMKTLTLCDHEYKLLLNMEDTVQLLTYDIELGLFGGGQPDQIFMSPADFQSIGQILRRDEQPD
jgi:hypothetical protein